MLTAVMATVRPHRRSAQARAAEVRDSVPQTNVCQEMQAEDPLVNAPPITPANKKSDGAEAHWEFQYKPLPDAAIELDALNTFHRTLERTPASLERKRNSGGGRGQEQRKYRRGSMSKALRKSVTQVHALADIDAEQSLVTTDILKHFPTLREQIACWDMDGTFYALLRLSGFAGADSQARRGIGSRSS